MSRGVGYALGIIAALSLIGGLVLGLVGPRTPTSVQADTFSPSALGHKALISLLNRLDVPLVVSRSATAQKAHAGTTLVLLEPPPGQGLRELVRDSAAEKVFVVLPRYRGVPHRETPGHIRRATEREDVDSVLKDLGLQAELVKGTTAQDWVFAEGFEAEPHLDQRRWVKGMNTLIGRGDRALVAWGWQGGKYFVVVSDPLLINNAGLQHGDNAKLAIRALGMAAEGRTLVIDEVLHGHRGGENIWSVLFEFPMFLVLLQALLLMGVAAWAAAGRFGPPLVDAPSLGRGRQVLIENTAALTRYCGHSGAVLEAWWQHARRDLRATLGLPPVTEGDLSWLSQRAQVLGTEEQAAEVAAAVRSAVESGEPSRVLAAARRAGRFMEEMRSR